jgi:hypothetical protein
MEMQRIIDTMQETGISFIDTNDYFEFKITLEQVIRLILETLHIRLKFHDGPRFFFSF